MIGVINIMREQFSTKSILRGLRLMAAIMSYLRFFLITHKKNKKKWFFIQGRFILGIYFFIGDSFAK